jgi:hypothetical protein
LARPFFQGLIFKVDADAPQEQQDPIEERDGSDNPENDVCSFSGFLLSFGP